MSVDVGPPLKPLAELTIQDLQETPVWQYFGARDSVALIEPTELLSLTDETTEVVIVRTNVLLHDGTPILGYCSPQDVSGFDYTQPVLILEGGEHIALYSEEGVGAHNVNVICESLRRQPKDVFPIKVIAAIPVDGACYETEVFCNSCN